jgi:hypothetical protein
MYFSATTESNLCWIQILGTDTWLFATFPDLLITVNFTALGVDNTTLSGSSSNAVLIYAAFHNNSIQDVVRVSRPTSLLPGMHLVGRVSMKIRSLIQNQALSTIGLVQVCSSILHDQKVVYLLMFI